MCRLHIDSITLVCKGRVWIAAVVRGTSGTPDDRGGMGRSAIPSSLLLDDLFNQGDDRVGALLLVGEG